MRARFAFPMQGTGRGIAAAPESDAALAGSPAKATAASKARGGPIALANAEHRMRRARRRPDSPPASVPAR